MKRRSFLAASSALAASSVTLATGDAQTREAKRRVAVIGHTGRGDYGHGLDTVWQLIPSTEIVAVADGSELGLAMERKKLGVEKGYTDYRKMLAEERPEFVSACPRHPDQHHDMAMAAIEAGVKGIYIEKPFCRAPAEADALIAASEKQGVKISVAHRNRYHPALKQIDRLIESGNMGRMLEIRGRGKGDHRGGGEDLWVLGGHVFNLFQYFAGDPKSCSAVMLQNGRHVTASDIKSGAEGLGPLGGNEVRARYETSSGVIAYYDSIANDDTDLKAYCLQLIGSKGIITIHIDANPVAHFTPGNPYESTAKPRPWIPITTAGLGQPETQPALVSDVHRHVRGIQDLIDACDHDRRPLCDAHDGATTIEMICGVFESHRQGGKAVSFPLEDRSNPLAAW